MERYNWLSDGDLNRFRELIYQNITSLNSNVDDINQLLSSTGNTSITDLLYNIDDKLKEMNETLFIINDTINIVTDEIKNTINLNTVATISSSNEIVKAIENNFRPTKIIHHIIPSMHIQQCCKHNWISYGDCYTIKCKWCGKVESRKKLY